jgi:hypothetical protein
LSIAPSILAPAPTEPARDRPRIAMISSALPPRLDGIGDYSAGLSSAFSRWADVSLHTVRGFAPESVDGVTVVQSFDISPRKAVADLEVQSVPGRGVSAIEAEVSAHAVDRDGA